jgi:hypothetical protein
VLFVVALLAAVSGASAAPRDDINWVNVEVVIRGDYFRAAMVAYDDFAKKLRERVRKAGTPGATGDVELTAYLSRIENFNIQVGFGHGRYTVWIAARASQEFPVVFGGDASYIVDGKEFTILEKKYGK